MDPKNRGKIKTEGNWIYFSRHCSRIWWSASQVDKMSASVQVMPRDITSPIWLGFLGGVTLLQAPWFARVHHWIPNMWSPLWIHWATSDACGSWPYSQLCCVINVAWEQSGFLHIVSFLCSYSRRACRLCPAAPWISRKSLPESHLLSFKWVYKCCWIWHRAWSRSEVAVTVSSIRRDREAGW